MMSAYTMDVLLNPGVRDKNMNLMSHDWKRKLTTSYDTCQDGKITKMVHKNYAAGKASSITSLPRAVDKIKEYQRDFPWHVNGKPHNNYVMNNQMPKLSNGSYTPKDHTQKKEDFLCNGVMEVKTSSSEANHYNRSCTGHSTNMIQLDGINSTGYASSKSKTSNVTWYSYRENDKDVWEDKMKENKELLKLYKTEFPDPVKSDRNKSKNMYLNMNLEKDKNIRYEPLSRKTHEPQMQLSHASHKHNSSRVFNDGHQNNITRNSVVKTSEKESKKSLFSVENIIDRTSNECYDVTENTDIGSPVEFQNMGPWGIKSITSLSETLGSVKNGSPVEYPNMNPWEIKDMTSLSQRLSAIKNAAAKSAFSPPECPNILSKRPNVMNGDQQEYPNTLMTNTGLMLGLAAENNTISEERRRQESKLFLNIPAGPTHPFKTRMKRSLAIYLGVDPEIDTIQYEPLNKNSFKTNSLPARHVSLNHYSKIHNMSRKEDRDTRVQSRKKSVYSCGYDVSSINTMLQNAKKRFKCYDNS